MGYTIRATSDDSQKYAFQSTSNTDVEMEVERSETGGNGDLK